MKAVSACYRKIAVRGTVIASVGVAGLALAATIVSVASMRGSLAHVFTVQSKVISSPDHLISAIRKFPIPFEPNVGQTAPQIKYLARANGYLVGLTERGLVLKLEESGTRRRLPITDPMQQHTRRDNASPVLVYIRPIRAATSPRLKPMQRLKSISNYFIGNNPKGWHARIPNYAAVRYQDIYPGVDWIVFGNPNRLEYDLLVAPRAHPQEIRFQITGVQKLALGRHGNLLITAGGQTLRELKPVVYQVMASGKRHAITGRYLLDGQQIAFSLGVYDHTRPLIIDPTLVYSTYLGGTSNDFATAVAVDSAGDAYVTGDAGSTDFPTTNPIQGTNKGDNIFISKFNADGNALVYSTYLGGTNGDEGAHGIAVDAAGNVYVTGTTFSEDFPTINAFQGTNKSTYSAAPAQAFATKLNAAGDALVYSTYLGGSGSLNNGLGIAIDSIGEAYVVGITNSTDFPTLDPYQGIYRGRGDIFVTKFSAAGNSLVYSTYLGGSAYQEANAVAVDSSGSAYITGVTNSTDFPLVNPFQATDKAAPSNSTNGTGFVTKFSPSGMILEYSTYLGGSNYDVPMAITVDNSDDAYVTGVTVSTDFPVVNAYQSQLLGGGNAFVTKLNPSGNALVYSTYLGGKGLDSAYGIAVDSTGDAYIVGKTTSADFPTVSPIQATNFGASFLPPANNAFITEFNPAGDKLLFSTFLGGTPSWGPTANHTTIPFDDSANAVALDSKGNVYVAGTAGSGNFPTRCPFQAENHTATMYGTADNAFVTKITTSSSNPMPCPSAPPSSSSTAASHGGGGDGWLLTLVLGLLAVLRKRKIQSER